MDKTRTKLVKILTLGFLVLFPFGQLLRSEVTLFAASVTIHPIDIIVGLTFLTLISGRFNKPHWYKSMTALLVVIIFSFVFSTTIFGLAPLTRGAFYLLRLTAYLYFFVALFNVTKGRQAKNTLYNSLIAVSVVVGLFGWIQYRQFPDLRSLFYIGWDDHLFRLIGTYLDPGFTSIIVSFGFLLSLVRFIEEKKVKFLIFCLFFLVTVAFTYARAAYIALLVGVFVVSKIRKSYTPVFLTSLGLLALVLFLPRPEGYGVKLERTHSIYAKLENYGQTLNIIKKAPLFGVGFNNFCVARLEFLGDNETRSHACNGSDSSFLHLFATTGVLGVLAAFKFLKEVAMGVRKDAYYLAFIGSFVLLFVHSIFVNSFFYPWVMGYMAILVSIKESS
ncbi:hypothetical protein A2129_00805 [Candidatus Woesebacteria bacterium GWC1_42_13]|uniref:O-antigen ligase-related domain-containing protein n=1 Tax=Candidatus Woesebacteria bacterium GWC1_42_13 TaxID=1802475 RepID=A0A1F7WVR4_9BACT|nr:MAG: hypothetical protein A2129_00805 [Candidatus Woesebacteria bacterium GWC1_42_13]